MDWKELQPITMVFFSSRRRHTRWPRDWSSDVCSSDLGMLAAGLLSDYLRTGSNNAAPFLRASEMLLRSLTDAGLDLDTAIRSVAVINNTCSAYTRDVVIAQNSVAALDRKSVV